MLIYNIFMGSKALKPMSPPLLHLSEDFLFVFLGPAQREQGVRDGQGYVSFAGGELVALNQADGALIWKREFPNAVDQFRLVDGKLYVLSLNEVLILDPDSGDELGKIDTQTSIPIERELAGSTTYVDQRYLYFTHHDDALLLVYDRETLQLVRRIEMPEGYRVKYHELHDTRTGEALFRPA